MSLFPIAVAYLIGAASGSLLLGPVFGAGDVRAGGSGNPGATNALRVGGKAYGAAVLAFDIAKGALAAGLLPLLAGGGEALAFACAAAAVLGHVWPAYYRFRGGKGAATLIGALLCTAPLALLPGLVAWLLSIVLTGYMGASILLAMTAVLVFLVAWHWALLVCPAVLFALAMWLLMVYTHRGNIARVLTGEENRFERIMLLRRWN